MSFSGAYRSSSQFLALIGYSIFLFVQGQLHNASICNLKLGARKWKNDTSLLGEVSHWAQELLLILAE